MPTRILKVYIEALTGFSHILSPGGLSNSALSRLHPWNWLTLRGAMGRTYIPRMGGGKELPIARAQLTGQPAVTFSPRPPPAVFICQARLLSKEDSFL